MNLMVPDPATPHNMEQLGTLNANIPTTHHRTKHSICSDGTRVDFRYVKNKSSNHKLSNRWIVKRKLRDDDIINQAVLIRPDYKQ